MIFRVNHSCRPNAYLVSENGMSIIRTAKKIITGEEITISYFPLRLPMMPMIQRREILEEEKNFLCRCYLCDFEYAHPESKGETYKKFEDLNDKLQICFEMSMWKIDSADHLSKIYQNMVMLFKEMYRMAKGEQCSALYLYHFIKRAFAVCNLGLYYSEKSDNPETLRFFEFEVENSALCIIKLRNYLRKHGHPEFELRRDFQVKISTIYRLIDQFNFID